MASTTLSDHRASGENAADAVDCAPSAADVPDDVCPEHSGGVFVPDESGEEIRSDCCPACGEQFAELQLRISQIERRLEELLADGCDETERQADATPNALELGDDPPEPPEDATASNPSTAEQEYAEVPAYTAHLVSEDVPSPPQLDCPGPSDRPIWAETYQSDDTDESVRDYVEQLLQRMSTDQVRKSRRSEPTVPAASDASRREQPDSSEDATATEAETLPPGEDSYWLASPLPAASQPDRPTAEPSAAVPATPAVVPATPAPAAVPASPTDDWAVSRTHESFDPVASNSPAESLQYAHAQRYSPRSLAPERLSNLNEMRELANISATAAIRTFEKGRATKSVFDRLPLVMVGLSCGLFLLYFASTCENQLMQLLLYVGVGFAFLAAVVAAGQALSVLIRWLATAQRPKAQPAADSHTTDTAATDED